MDCEQLICRQCANNLVLPLFTICDSCIQLNAAYRAREIATARQTRIYELKKCKILNHRTHTGNFRDPDTGKEHRYRKGKNRGKDQYVNDDVYDKYTDDERTVNSRTLYHGENYNDE